jgi:hypothetical protein
MEYVEYVDSNKSINVHNLPLFEPIKLMVKNIITIKGSDNIELKEFINFIEFSLFDKIDYIFKIALKSYSNDYYICGGKAISDLYFSDVKSFDFDIHVNHEDDILSISRHICSNMNNNFFSTLKKQLYEFLLSINAIDSTLENYYTNNNFFFFGRRKIRKRDIYILIVFF